MAEINDWVDVTPSKINDWVDVKPADPTKSEQPSTAGERQY